MSMNQSHRRRRSIAPFAALLVCAVLFVLFTSRALPNIVASHFGPSGEANGFMPHGVYVGFMLTILFVVPLALVVLPHRLFNKPNARINLPNREYWLAPERREKTIEFLSRQSMRFAAMLLVFLCYAHGLVVRANALTPPILSSLWLLGGVVIFLLATLVWIVSLLGHFRNVPE